MQKIIKVDNTTIVIFDDNTCIQRENLPDEIFNALGKDLSDDEAKALLASDRDKAIIAEAKNKINLQNAINESSLLILKNKSVYWEDVSPLSLPIELAEAISKAEQENNKLLLETYKNFWTLMSLNPDERCRLNLFWFLNRNGLVISKSGYFVAYRNADATDIPGVFTDAHTGTFTIKIGEMVTMPREKCDACQDHTCSQGLHLGSSDWLKQGYYGNTGLVCLCNPADVVAVPPRDDYGKLRTCAYLPIDYASFDEYGNVHPYNKPNGFECEYIPKVIYEGLFGTESDSNYKLIIPDIPELNKQSITDQLLNIAQTAISDRIKVLQ